MQNIQLRFLLYGVTVAAFCFSAGKQARPWVLPKQVVVAPLTSCKGKIKKQGRKKTNHYENKSEVRNAENERNGVAGLCNAGGI